jgi:chaperonin cofactor prefoldin
MTRTIVGGSEKLDVRVQNLEHENKVLGAKVTELQRQLQTLETNAYPLNARLVRALQPS